MLLGMQKNQLGDAAYTQTGLSSTNCTLGEGGYYQVGKLVVVNIRLTASESIASSSDILTGLPRPAGTSSNYVPVAINWDDICGYLQPNGKVLVRSKSGTSINTNTVIMIGCTYLAQ